jgi:hypothetical protein
LLKQKRSRELDDELIRLIGQNSSPLNPVLAEGLASHHMQYAEKFVDDVLRSAAKGFPDGLTYTGYSRCTPSEEYAQAIRRRNSRRGRSSKQNKRTFETARSDVYLMKYHFRWQGVDLPVAYMYLPFVGKASSITLSGSRFHIAPTMADRVLSIGKDNIFMRLLRDKLTFHRLPHAYLADERTEVVQIVHGLIHHKGKTERSSKKTVNAVTCMTHYLMCKYGFTETFKRFANCTPVVGNDLSPSDYPEDQWVICRSTEKRPKGISRAPSRLLYEAPKIRIAIRRDQYTPMVKALLAGFFYVVDHFPQQMPVEYIDSQRQWMMLLAHILFSGNLNAGRLYDSVANHMESLDDYVDNVIREHARDIGINIQDIYEFFAIIIENFNEWLRDGADKINSMYDKELSVLYFVFADVIKAIFKFYFAIKAASKKGLTPDEISKITKTHLRMGTVFSLNNGHKEVTTSSYSGDNMATKITCMLEQQSGSDRRGKGNDRAAIGDPSKKLHISVAEIGAYSGMPKSDPSGRSRLNLHAKVNHRGIVERNPELLPLLEPIQQKIKAR